VVSNLCDGWYGNAYLFDNNIHSIDLSTGFFNLNNCIITRKKAFDCRSLFNHTIEQANTIFIPFCDGISGKLGLLIVENDHVPNNDGWHKWEVGMVDC
jgi:hypothetical protein